MSAKYICYDLNQKNIFAIFESNQTGIPQYLWTDSLYLNVCLSLRLYLHKILRQFLNLILRLRLILSLGLYLVPRHNPGAEP